MARREKPAYKKELRGRELTPGELYREIAVSRDEFESAEAELVKEKPNWYVKFCKKIYSSFPSLGKGAKFEKKYKDALDFLHWKISAPELAATSKFVLFAGIIGAIVAALLVFVFLYDLLADLLVGMEFMLPIYAFAPFLIIALAVFYYIQSYPLKAAKAEQVRALTYISEIIGYMIMSIKLVPNLEKAVEFAAVHGKGRIAEDFRRLLWDVQIGVYPTLSEGLDALAYRWGNYSSEFKQALMRIRASVIEDTEAKRYALLDQTMEEVLESIKNKMEQYAHSLNEPSVMLFYIGVLLPLILIIILPVGSTFSGAALATPLTLLLIYNILIPAVTFGFALMVIRSRPPTYTAPTIPDNFPGLPKKWRMRLGKREFDIRFMIAIVLVVGIVASAYISDQGIPPRDFGEEGDIQFIPYTPNERDVLARAGYNLDRFEVGSQFYQELLIEFDGSEARAQEELLYEKQVFFMQSDNDVTPLTFIFGALLTIAICLYIFFYYTSIYKRKIQKDIMVMESEFKDSLYVLASRLGENKPIEDALKHAKEFLPNLRISQTIFARILDNIALLGMPFETAVFDPNYGALKHNPSSIIRGTMSLIVDSVQLGVNMAARTLMSLSMQLSNAEKVNQTLKTMISEISGMMRSMGMFIAPVVLGITTGLQKIVVLTISSISASDVFETTETTEYVLPGIEGIDITSTFSSMNMFGQREVLGQLATPTQFIFIVAFYIIELVIIMTFFVSKVEEDNNLLLKINIARALPIAVGVFVVTVLVTNSLLGNFMAG